LRPGAIVLAGLAKRDGLRKREREKGMRQKKDQQ